MTDWTERANYFPVSSARRLLACLGCGLLILDDPAVMELHAVLHGLLDELGRS